QRLAELVVLEYRDRAVGAAIDPARAGRRDRHVRLDADAVDQRPRRGDVQRRRELDRAAGADRHDRLHGAFAVGLRADETRAAVVLERGRDNLGRGRGAAVHEHDERHVLERVAAARIALEARLPRAPAAADDQSFLQEQVRNLDRCIEHAARIVAEIENETVEPAGSLRAQRVVSGFEIGGRRVRERREPDVAEAIGDQLRAHRLDVDIGARDGEIERLRSALALHAQLDDRAGFAAHAADRLLETVGAHRLAVDGDQHVAGLDSGLGGRRAFERRDDLDDAVLDAEIETDARIVAGRADPHLFVIARGEILRVRVELAQNAANRVLDDASLLDRVYVLVPHAFYDARQELDVLGLDTAGAGDRDTVRVAARVESGFALREHSAAERGREPKNRARREYQNAPYVQGHTRKPPLGVRAH